MILCSSKTLSKTVLINILLLRGGGQRQHIAVDLLPFALTAELANQKTEYQVPS